MFKLKHKAAIAAILAVTAAASVQAATQYRFTNSGDNVIGGADSEDLITAIFGSATFSAFFNTYYEAGLVEGSFIYDGTASVSNVDPVNGSTYENIYNYAGTVNGNPFSVVDGITLIANDKDDGDGGTADGYNIGSGFDNVAAGFSGFTSGNYELVGFSLTAIEEDFIANESLLAELPSGDYFAYFSFVNTLDSEDLQVITTEITITNDDLGDINNDGLVDSADILELERALLGLTTLLSSEEDRADCFPAIQGDGQITLSDLLCVQELAIEYPQ